MRLGTGAWRAWISWRKLQRSARGLFRMKITWETIGTWWASYGGNWAYDDSHPCCLLILNHSCWSKKSLKLNTSWVISQKNAMKWHKWWSLQKRHQGTYTYRVSFFNLFFFGWVGSRVDYKITHYSNQQKRMPNGIFLHVPTTTCCNIVVT